MTKLSMKSLILSLFLVFALFQNASAATVPAVFDIPVHDAVASIDQKLRSSDAFLFVFVNTQTIEFSIPTTSSEIRIYSSKGVMVGHNNFYFENSTTGTVWVTLDMVEGEAFTMMFWNSVDQTEKELAVTWNATKSYSLYPLDCKYYYASDLFSETVTFKVPTKLVDVKDQTEIAIYPNPASEYILVSCLGNGAGRLVLTNINGVVVKTVEFSQSAETIRVDVASLSEGVYLVQLQQFGKSIGEKIVITH